jgi:hypothetical protein
MSNAEDTLATISAALEAMPKQLEEKAKEIAAGEFNEEKNERLFGEARAGLVALARSYQKQVGDIRAELTDEPFDEIAYSPEHTDKLNKWERMNPEERQLALHDIKKGQDNALAEALAREPKLLSSLAESNQLAVLTAVYGEDRIDGLRKNHEMRARANRVLAAIERTIHGLR